jgi:hypothetical protein
MGGKSIHIATFPSGKFVQKALDVVRLNLHYDGLETKNLPILRYLGKWGTGMISA